MSRQLRQRSRGKEGSAPVRERWTFAFCLRTVAFVDLLQVDLFEARM